MFKEDMKLPEVKHLMKIDEEFQPIISFLQSGNYIGHVFPMIEKSELLTGNYNGSVVFSNSSILNKIDNFMTNLSTFAQNGNVKLSQEEYNSFHSLAKNIIVEYNQIMDRYKRS